MKEKRTPDEINTEFAQLTLLLGQNALNLEAMDEKRIELFAQRKQIIKRVHELSEEMKKINDDKSGN